MGYTTEFSGALTLSRPLSLAEAKEILDVHEQDVEPIGENPGGYMQWVPTEDLAAIVWDQGEKFYNYVPWLEWLCRRLAAWGVEANGVLRWQGESVGDTGTITVTANTVQAVPDDVRAPTGSRRPLDRRRLGELAIEFATKPPTRGT